MKLTTQTITVTWIYWKIPFAYHSKRTASWGLRSTGEWHCIFSCAAAQDSKVRSAFYIFNKQTFISWIFFGQRAASRCGEFPFRELTPSQSSGCDDGLVANNQHTLKTGKESVPEKENLHFLTRLSARKKIYWVLLPLKLQESYHLVPIRLQDSWQRRQNVLWKLRKPLTQRQSVTFQ
jgi:hypothetical protein